MQIFAFEIIKPHKLHSFLSELKHLTRWKPTCILFLLFFCY